MAERFAVIDTETNWVNEVMSVGIVIAEDGLFEVIDKKYVIIGEAARKGGMYSGSLRIKGQKPAVMKHGHAVNEILSFLDANHVKRIYAYNAPFDLRCLPELGDYMWHDILRMAAYKQHNHAIPSDADCCGTGRLKSGYKVGDILHLFGEHDYYELHNALTDAVDELRIMKYLRHSIRKYPVL